MVDHPSEKRFNERVPAGPLARNQRPSEIVRSYLEREFFSPDAVAGTRLPTIEELAQHLGVGLSTVRGVLRQLNEEGRLQTSKGRGTILRAPAKAALAPLTLATNISHAGASQEHPTWSECIYLGATRASGLMARPISILPVAHHDATPPEEISRELLRLIGCIDLLMLFPTRNHALHDYGPLRAAFEEAGKPVIDINPPSLAATTNFVSANFFEAAYRIGKAWHAAGRRRFLFVSPRLHSSVSAQLYLAGLGCGCRRDEDPAVRFQVFIAGNNTESAGAEAARRILAQPDEPPDAVLCFGDTLAGGFLNVLRESQMTIPGEVSLVGGTGLSLTRRTHPDLGMILQPMEQIGAGAMRTLVHRKEHHGAPSPGLYLPCRIGAGATLRPEEHALME